MIATCVKSPGGETRRQVVEAVRCAIYTRKSTDEGLDNGFTSLDAQREAAEAFIQSRRELGWQALPERYDDGGFTGANMERPALKRLLSDMASGRVDCVVVYKVDRLSRSLLDFARLMHVFEEHEVSFVSVTQNFDTSDSVGRLLLNILFSFAQFERETIADRTRDKMRAARRKGKWTGGYPVLGYDVVEKRLVVNKEEEEQVREIFSLYLERGSVRPVVEEINARAWRNKSWLKKDGRPHEGGPFTINTVLTLLKNPLYIGKVRANGDLHEGEHEGIVDAGTWKRAQALITKNGRTAGGETRNKHSALLRGLLRCTPCDAPMVHTYTKKKDKLYRYYVCSKAMKHGWKTCPSKSLPAAEIEQLVVDRIREIGQDEALIRETVREIRKRAKEQTRALQVERRKLQADLRRQKDELKGLLAALSEDNGRLQAVTQRIGEIEGGMEKAGSRLKLVRQELVALQERGIDEGDVARALAAFGPVWDELFQAEKERIIRLVIERVDYDGTGKTLEITLGDAGIGALAGEISQETAQ